MAKQVDSTNIGTLLEALITKIKSFFWRKSETSELPIDNTPTSGSNNLVKSGGVYSSLQGIRQLKVLNLGDFHPNNEEVTLGTKAEAAAALNITEAQVDSLLNGEYDYIEFGVAFYRFGGYKISLVSPYESVYMCLGTGSHFVTMPYLLEFWNKNNAGVYSYNYAPIGIKDVTVGGESVIGSGSQNGVAVIPAIPDVSQFITRSVNDLANYYLKSETYTQTEVNNLIGAIQQFHYEIAASTSAVTNPSNNVLYLIGPTGSGSDKYEEYVYSNGWVKIGDTSIDLSGYVTIQALNNALSAYTTTNDLMTLLAGKQDTIDAQHKLDYSLIANTPTIPTVPTDIVKYTSQSLTDAQKAQARTNIGATAPEVFWATYGTTTLAQIEAAINIGKCVMLKYDHTVSNSGGDIQTSYILNLCYFIHNSIAIFVSPAALDTALSNADVRCTISLVNFFKESWNEPVFMEYQNVGNKVTSWQTTPDDTHYPSEKLVKDSLDGKQPTIDASHKLDYSLLSNTPTVPTVPTDIVKYTAQTLTDAQKSQARTNIGATAPEIFWAEYGVTTVAEIKAQVDAGKVVLLSYTSSKFGIPIPLIYSLSISTTQVAYFVSIFFAQLVSSVHVDVQNGASVWTEEDLIAIENANNKVTSWQSTPDNDHYPSEKLVKDSLDGKQPTIDASHKLDYSLLSNTPTVPTTYAGSPTAGGFANKAVAIPFGNVDSTSTATEITATVDNFPETLTDGVCAFIRNNVVASASGFTLNINGTGAKPVYQTLADASRSTTVFNANSTYLFVYNSTRVEGGCWDLYYGYNSNDNTIGYNLRTNGASAPPAAQKYYRYRLLFMAANNQSLVPANTSSSTNATAAKTVNQTKIDPFGVIFYYSYTSAVNAGSSPNASYLWMQYNGIALGYSFNRTGEALEMTARDPVYLKCAPQSDGSAIIDADNPIVQALPTTADGKIYIFLGFAESATAITLYYWHPVYYHDGTSVRLWTGKEASGGGSETKTLSLKGNPASYFDKADVMNVVNDALFFFTMELFTQFDPGIKIGTAVFVGYTGNYACFELRVYSGTDILSYIIKFYRTTTTGDVTSIVYDGNTYNYNSATDRYEKQS